MKDRKVISQLEGQHRVAAELLARGYIPTLLAERTVGYDLLVLSPEKEKFGLEVKTNRKRNAWFCRRPTDDDAEIWVFVVLEPKPLFSVMTRDQVRDEWDQYRQMKPRKPTDQGMLVGQVARYEGRWEVLPS